MKRTGRTRAGLADEICASNAAVSRWFIEERWPHAVFRREVARLMEQGSGSPKARGGQAVPGRAYPKGTGRGLRRR